MLSYSPGSFRSKFISQRFAGIAAAIVAAATLLAGCAGGGWWPWGEGSGGEVPRIAPGAKYYACEAGKKLIVRYGADNRYAMIIFPEREFRLDAEGSTAGSKFSNGRTVLSTSGDEAMLEEAGTVLFAKCKPEPGA
ncbi:MAG: MliC family protein [Betaproteobacteria bacterium]|nr:MliC family protein [Betaproteobacteria bacterium]